jgi:hypothetical protein
MDRFIGLQRHARIAELRADLAQSLKRMDGLGLAIAANHVDHAIALMEAEICSATPESEAQIISAILFAPA